MVTPDAVGSASARVRDETLFKCLVADPGVHLELGVEGFFRVRILYEFHAGEKSKPPDIPDDGMPGQRLQLFQEILAHPGGTIDQIMGLKVVQHRQGGGAGQGILTIGVAVHEGAVALFDRVMDMIIRHDTEDRGVARGHALGADDHVRDHLPVVNGEVLSRPADSRHDLVDDQQDVITVADFPDLLKIAVLRHQRACRGTHHRFGDEGRHGVRPLVEDRFFQIVSAFDAAGFRLQIEGTAVTVAGDDMGSMLDQRLVILPTARVAAQGQRPEGVAVIARPPGDDFVFGWLAAVYLILAGHLDGGFHRFGAAG